MADLVGPFADLIRRLKDGEEEALRLDNTLPLNPRRCLKLAKALKHDVGLLLAVFDGQGVPENGKLGYTLVVNHDVRRTDQEEVYAYGMNVLAPSLRQQHGLVELV